MSALALIILLVAKAPQIYAARCAPSFFAALQLVKDLSVDSRITRSLLSRIYTLKDGWNLIQQRKRQHQHQIVAATSQPAPAFQQYSTTPGVSEDDSISYDKVSHELQSLFSSLTQGVVPEWTNGKSADTFASIASFDMMTPDGYDAAAVVEQQLNEPPYGLEEWIWGEWLDAHII